MGHSCAHSKYYLQPATYDLLLITCYLLLTTYYFLLPAAYCLLPTAYCLLPTYFFLLTTADCRLLPTAYSLGAEGLSPDTSHRPADDLLLAAPYYVLLRTGPRTTPLPYDMRNSPDVPLYLLTALS